FRYWPLATTVLLVGGLSWWGWRAYHRPTPPGPFARGYAAFIREDYDAALREFDQALAVNRLDALAWYYRGRIYYEKKDYPRAVVAFNEAIRLAPTDPEMLAARYDLYLREEKDYDLALKDANTVETLAPKENPAGPRMVGRVYYLQKH